jgi:dihydrofolate synthase/folylpolyglutamate synthase
VDAAHNPHGAAALAAGLQESFRFSRLVAVVAVLADKDAAGIIRAVAEVVDDFVVTTAPSERTRDADDLAATVVGIVGADRVVVEPDLDRALTTARALAVDAEPDADPESDDVEAVPGVVVFGSITLVARALQLVREEGWSAG